MSLNTQQEPIVKAIIQISKIYSNISVQALQRRLNVSYNLNIEDYTQILDQVERLIQEQKIKAQIDQVKDIIYFDQGIKSTSIYLDKSDTFNQNIEHFCKKLQNCTNKVHDRMNK